MIDLKKLAETLVSLSIKDINNLSNILKEEYGIDQNISYTNQVHSTVEEPNNKKEKQFFNVIVKSHGTSKLSCIKVIKEITGLGLKESKDIVDNLPKTIKENIKQEEAISIKNKLEEVGAEVELN
jgi:large subunit ribosomal protein L7/L12